MKVLLDEKLDKTSQLYKKTDQNINFLKLNSAVVIPALNPIPNLVDYVEELLAHGVAQVIVVNDGSDSSYNKVFHKLEQLENCTVLSHKVNHGKGRALKTAFSYFLEHLSYLDGVVTADADGQHDVLDICQICEKLSLNQNSLILGVRNFKAANVPMRSYIGNTLTSRIFQLLYGYYILDTQTGLRGIPVNHIPWIVELNGERYEYEINMLINAKKHGLGLSTIPIKTLYYNNNSGSHYGTIKDSAKILKCLIIGLKR